VFSRRKKLIQIYDEPKHVLTIGQTTMHLSAKKGIPNRLHPLLIRIKTWKTYKLEQESVFPQGPDTACKTQDEHHPSHHQKQPHWVKSTQICDGGDIRENSLRKRERERKRDETGL